MAKMNQGQEPNIVQCAYCHQVFDLKTNKKAISFGHYDKKREMQYFCDRVCMLAKLFDITDSNREFVIGLENGR